MHIVGFARCTPTGRSGPLPSSLLIFKAGRPMAERVLPSLFHLSEREAVVNTQNIAKPRPMKPTMLWAKSPLMWIDV